MATRRKHGREVESLVDNPNWYQPGRKVHRKFFKRQNQQQHYQRQLSGSTSTTNGSIILSNNSNLSDNQRKKPFDDPQQWVGDQSSFSRSINLTPQDNKTQTIILDDRSSDNQMDDRTISQGSVTSATEHSSASKNLRARVTKIIKLPRFHGAAVGPHELVSTNVKPPLAKHIDSDLNGSNTSNKGQRNGSDIFVSKIKRSSLIDQMNHENYDTVAVPPNNNFSRVTVVKLK